FAGELLSSLREVESILSTVMEDTKGLRLVIEAPDNVKSKMASKSIDTYSKMTQVNVTPLSAGKALPLLRKEADRLELSKKLKVGDDTLLRIAKLAERYIGSVALPASGLGLLHKVAAEASVKGSEEITLKHVADVLSAQTGVPAELLSKQDSERIASLRTELP